MSDALLPHSPAPLPSMPEILRRAAVPFALFSGVLAALMLLSWYLLLPLFTRVDIGGTVLDLSSLLSYRIELQAKLTSAETARAATLLPQYDSSYDTLKQERQKRPTVFGYRHQFRQIAAGVVEQNDAVHLSSFALRPDGKTLELTGDVRFVGPRSMTVLAEFIEALKNAPFVGGVSMPRFIREEDPVTGPHSPFTVHVTLK